MSKEILTQTIIITGIIIIVLSLTIGFGLNKIVMAQEHATTEETEKTDEHTTIKETTDHQTEQYKGGLSDKSAIYFSVAFVIGLACVAAAYAVGKVGAAAMGAAAERPELATRGLIFVGLAEGIAIYGLIIAIMLLGKA